MLSIIFFYVFLKMIKYLQRYIQRWLWSMLQAVHYKIAGRLALSSKQKVECQVMRERVALMSCNQPCQEHHSHRHTDHALKGARRITNNLAMD
jgi:hypothetical protein